MASLSHEPQVDYVPTQAETDWLRLLGDTGIDLDRDAALLRYARHFNLDDGELDRHGMLANSSRERSSRHQPLA